MDGDIIKQYEFKVFGKRGTVKHLKHEQKKAKVHLLTKPVIPDHNVYSGHTLMRRIFVYAVELEVYKRF